jgi:2-phospho-L-lactate guanylyltransferase
LRACCGAADSLPARIVIPARAPQLGKSRLADALAPTEREALAMRLFQHVVGTAMAARPGTAVHVVSSSPELLARAEALGANGLAEQGEGLNEALEQASRALGGEDPILTLSIDLPLLEAADVAAMLAQEADVACATDEAGEGTNALLLRRPGLIPYAYGPGSLAAHRAAAAARGLSFAEVRRPGLARDLDLPADLALLGPGWSPSPLPTDPAGE